MQQYRNTMKGVTLMEMLVVVVIIGILSGIAIPNFIGIVKNNRVRTRALKMLNILRDERSRAIALQREIELTLKRSDDFSECNPDCDYSYTVTRLPYVLYDPLSADRYTADPDVLSREYGRKVLVQDKPFDEWNWLDHKTEDVVMNSDTNVNTFTVTFLPSGTIQMDNGIVIGRLSLKGEQIGFDIELLKAGQIRVVDF